MQDVTNTAQKGFTLVELLIVVIILALLAAIVVPQFASSTDDAKVSSLDTSLSNVRAAVDLYYQQHGEYPAAKTSVPTAACGGTSAAALLETPQAFLDQMSMFTDAEGGACTQKDVAHKYGPYLKKNTLPNNPITEISTLVVITDGDLLMTGNAVAAGWKYDTVVGKFIADDAAYDDH